MQAQSEEGINQVPRNLEPALAAYAKAHGLPSRCEVMDMIRGGVIELRSEGVGELRADLLVALAAALVPLMIAGLSFSAPAEPPSEPDDPREEGIAAAASWLAANRLGEWNSWWSSWWFAMNIRRRLGKCFPPAPIQRQLRRRTS